MATKLDMSKAFDRVEWFFIQRVMERMGFNTRWINWVMLCITTVSYSVIINGVVWGNITPTRGLCQGDPFSLSLFLLCVEGLSAVVNEAARNQQWMSISICRGCPRITHLFFADDSILFSKANAKESQKLKQILQTYEEAFGQKINIEKSSMFFSPNMPQSVKEKIFAILGPMQGSKHSKYLGLPSFIGRSKK